MLPHGLPTMTAFKAETDVDFLAIRPIPDERPELRYGVEVCGLSAKLIYSR
jgi:hypothetical protein